MVSISVKTKNTTDAKKSCRITSALNTMLHNDERKTLLKVKLIVAAVNLINVCLSLKSEVVRWRWKMYLAKLNFSLYSLYKSIYLAIFQIQRCYKSFKRRVCLNPMAIFLFSETRLIFEFL